MAGSESSQPRLAFRGSESAGRWFARQDGWWDAHYAGAVDEISSFLEGDGISLSGRAVVDIGCGDGIISLGLANRTGAGSVIGMDLEPVDTEFLAALARAHGVPETNPVLDFKLAQPTALPLADSSADVAITWSVFEHVKDLPGLLSEIRRVLKPDGYLFCQVWPLYHSENGSHLWNWLDPFAHLVLADDALRQRLRARAPDVAAAMLDLYDTCSRVTVDDVGRHLVDGGFFVAKAQLTADGFHVPAELQDVPLSLLAISGFKILAVNHK